MSRMTRTIAKAATMIAVVLSLTPAVTAQPYPSQPVHFLVAFAPGGVADIVARIVGQKLSEHWQQPVIVENRGGAGGNIAASLVAKAEPNGYTILVTTSAFVVNPSLYKKPGYNVADFDVAGFAATTPNVIVGAPNFRATTLRDVIASAKSETLAYGSPGTGTTPHLSAERILRFLNNCDIAHVPFTGAGPALNAVMGGHVPLASVAMSAATEIIRSGRAKGLAVTSAKRVKALPEVPTVAELGLGDVDDATWVALFIPAKTPADVITKVNSDLDAVVKDANVIAQLDRIGFAPLGGTRTEAKSYLKNELAKWSEIVGKTGLKMD